LFIAVFASVAVTGVVPFSSLCLYLLFVLFGLFAVVALSAMLLTCVSLAVEWCETVVDLGLTLIPAYEQGGEEPLLTKRSGEGVWDRWVDGPL
jgi:hypothetical protein